MADDKLRNDIEDELLWEPRIDDAGIDVSVDDGTVTLRGIVASFREHRDAGQAVKRVYGVKRVHNELRVQLRNGRRDDAELQNEILQALALDACVPPTVDVTVRDGHVSLTGTASFQFQRDEAEFVAGNVMGVGGVDNQMELRVTSAGASDITDWIECALRRDAQLDAASVSVESQNGTVILSGTVGSWTQHDAALNAAWAAPGVMMVDDRMLVVYPS